ncbi:MAG: HD domain-containing protein [Victivallaceae bacterium]|nr:HD domain-containing protein [Victivallaceae bacterium]
MNYTRELLNDFEQAFSTYTDGFLSGKAEFDKNVLLKTEHSLLVQQECRYLAEAENFSPRLAILVETAGLFHDIGRFEQIRRYNTFVDSRSIDHGDFGYEVLLKNNMLSPLPENDRNIILAGIKFHNKRQLAPHLEAETLLTVRAVRDADKLDIMRVMLNEYSRSELDPAVILHLEESDAVSPPVLAHLEKGENPNIADFRTLTDFKLAQLAWIYDLNFTHSLLEFKKRRIYERIAELLPDTPQINMLSRKMFDYLENKTA